MHTAQLNAAKDGVTLRFPGGHVLGTQPTGTCWFSVLKAHEDLEAYSFRARTASGHTGWLIYIIYIYTQTRSSQGMYEKDYDEMQAFLPST